MEYYFTVQYLVLLQGLLFLRLLLARISVSVVLFFIMSRLALALADVASASEN